MWSGMAVQVTKGGVVNATTSLPLRWHCLWLNHVNHFNKHPLVLHHIVVGAIRTCSLNLSSTSQNQSIDVGVDLLWWLESWNGSEKYDSWHDHVYLNFCMSNSNGNDDMVWWCKVLYRDDDMILMTIFTALIAAYLRYRDTAIKRSNQCKF